MSVLIDILAILAFTAIVTAFWAATFMLIIEAQRLWRRSKK